MSGSTLVFNHSAGTPAFIAPGSQHSPVVHYVDQGRPGNISNLGNGSTTLFPVSNGTTTSSIPIPPSIISQPPCQWILYEDIGESRVRIWDLIILIPNALFLMFLLWNLKIALAKLRNSNSPIFAAFYLMVVAVAVISVLRCIVSMTVNASVLAGDITDKALWLVLKFFLLATELSVIVFGLAFGHLDSGTSIRRVLIVTTAFAFIYSCIQATLEFTQPDPKFRVDSGVAPKDYDIFGHGGMIFLITTSAFFYLVYTVVYILPWTRLKDKLNLPSKRSFYYYAFFLAALNLTQTIGSSLLYTENLNGMCVVDTTTYIYFTCFAPLVYGTFLREFFRVTQPSILFSYKSQVDEGPEEDTVSMPYQAANAKRSDDEGSHDGSFDSTHFAGHGLVNSLNADVYSPGSLSANMDYYQNPNV